MRGSCSGCWDMDKMLGAAHSVPPNQGHKVDAGVSTLLGSACGFLSVSIGCMRNSVGPI